MMKKIIGQLDWSNWRVGASWYYVWEGIPERRYLTLRFDLLVLVLRIKL